MDPFKLAGVSKDELEKAATICNETMTALERLRRKSEALLTARANEAIANKRDVSQALDEELSNLIKEERKLHKEFSNASMRYRQLLDKLKYRHIPPPIPPHPLATRIRRSWCHSSSVKPVHLLSHWYTHGCMSQIIQLADEIRAGECYPRVHIYLSGPVANSSGEIEWWYSCVGNGTFTWGFDVRALHIRKLEISGRLRVGGFFYVPTPLAFSYVDLVGNLVIAQYRGCGQSVTELDIPTVCPYRIWRAYSECEDYTETRGFSPGWITLNRHSAGMNLEIDDVRQGDSFVLEYIYGVRVADGIVYCDLEDDYLHLVIYPPKVVQYVCRFPWE